jgi:hypothetical protein
MATAANPNRGTNHPASIPSSQFWPRTWLSPSTSSTVHYPLHGLDDRAAVLHAYDGAGAIRWPDEERFQLGRWDEASRSTSTSSLSP